MKPLKKPLAGALAASFSLLLIGAALQETLKIVRYRILTDKIRTPARFIVIADLHSSRYGVCQMSLVAAVKKQKPDAVFFVGDMIDERVPPDEACRLFEELGSSFPCYYVSGNHEFRTGSMDAIKRKLRSCGVAVLEGDTLPLSGGEIYLSGIDDPAGFPKADRFGWRRQIERCRREAKPGAFRILLSHRPERVSAYAKSGADLVVCGHAHGGQVRVPFLLNGLYAPGQGLFPKYAGGLYRLTEKTSMVVSRGLCRNRIPRVFNPPELVVIDLAPANSKKPEISCAVQ